MDLLLDGLGRGLAFGLAFDMGRFATGLETLDLLELLLGLSAGLGSIGVSGRIPLRRAYGSAVFGRVISGRRGRRTGPDMSDPVVGTFEDDMVISLRLIPVAVGGRAVLLDEVLEGTRTWLLEVDLMGENVDIAEVGRSGTRLAAICFFCAAIISLKFVLLAVCDDRRSGLEG